MNYKIIITIYFFLSTLSLNIYAQNGGESTVSHKVSRLYNKSTPNADKTYGLGIQILKIAKTGKEYSYGYSLLADALRKKEDYSRAIFFYKKVDSISILLNDVDRRFMANLFMAGIYNRVGLLSRADESLSISKILKERANVNFGHYYLLLIETHFLEMSFNYCQAIPKRIEILEEISDLKDKESSDGSVVAFSHAVLAYDYIKCEQLSKAQFHIDKADSIIKVRPQINSSIIIASYKMVKGIYAAENHDVKQAKLWFDEALRNSRKNNLDNERMKILEERLNYNLDEPAVRKSLIKEINTLRLKRTVEAAKIIDGEEQYKNEIISSKEKHLQLFLVITIIAVITIFFLVRSSATKRKITERRFKELIEQIQTRDVELENKNVLASQLQDDDQADSVISKSSEGKICKLPNKNLLSEEKEIELLAKLKCFESGELFLNSNFSISMMAAHFETNSKYINFLLQKHRNKLFSDYINSMRINYITKLLYQEPAYLNYKISYLSERCGFSSHSRFASIFKKETGISPSDYIAQLLRENASDEES